jgi:hypothetical protein
VRQGGLVYKHSIAAWEGKTYDDALRELTVAIRMSGRFRTEFRRKINEYVRRLENPGLLGKSDESSAPTCKRSGFHMLWRS